MKSQVVTFFGCILFMVVAFTLVTARKPGKAAPVDGKKFYYPKESRSTSVKHRNRRDDVVYETNSSAQKTLLYQNYNYDNLTGEYVHELQFSDTTRKTEIGGYVSGHDKYVYVIRGFYSYIQPESGLLATEVYVIDDNGYHSIQYQLSQESFPDSSAGYVPSAEVAGCGVGKGDYNCIDPQLLKLLVG